MVKLKDLLLEKQDKKMFDRIVKALKDVKFRATIHLNDEDKITIALGRDYLKKKNPQGEGTLEDEVLKRLKKAGISKGPFDVMKGIDIMADSSDINDKKYTKAQQNIRGGV